MSNSYYNKIFGVRRFSRIDFSLKLFNENKNLFSNRNSILKNQFPKQKQNTKKFEIAAKSSDLPKSNSVFVADNSN